MKKTIVVIGAGKGLGNGVARKNGNTAKLAEAFEDGAKQVH